MSYRERIGNAYKALRGETEQRGETTYNAWEVGGTAFSATDPYSFKPKGIKGQWFNVNAQEHRNYWAWSHPWGHKICYQVPEYLWASPVEVKDNQEDQVATEGPVTDAIELLEGISYRDNLTHANKGEFIHGWAVLALYEEGESFLDLHIEGDAARGWQEDTATLPYLHRVPKLNKPLAHIDAFWGSDLQVGTDNLDEMLWPKSYRYFYDKARFVDLDATRCILVRTRPRDRTFRGVPIIEPGWNSLIYQAAMDSSFNWATAKFGQTSFAIPTKGAVSSAQVGDIQKSMKEWHKDRPLIYDSTTASEPKVVKVFDGYPDSFAQVNLEQYSSSIGFPQLWVRGDKVGSVSGSGEDALNVNGRLRQLQHPWKSTLWRLVGAVNPENIGEDVRKEYGFFFNIDQRLDEKGEAELWSSRSTAVGGLMQVSTPNEIRENVLGLEPMEGGDETPLEREERQMEQQTQRLEKGFGATSVKAPGKDKPKEKPKPEQRGEELRYTSPYMRLPAIYGKPWHKVVDASYEEHGTVRGICQSLNVSGHTIKDMRKRYFTETGVEPIW